MKIKNGKEIIVGKTLPGKFLSVKDIPFFIKDIKQLCFIPYNKNKYKFGVFVKTEYSKNNEFLVITKEQYDYLQEKLGANDDENY